MEFLDLKFENGSSLKIRNERFQQTREELEVLLDGQKHIHTKAFARDVMFSHELKANNQIEGYFDDVDLIREIIEKKFSRQDSNQAKRILNLYHGYNFILREKDINKNNLKKLYSILSKDLLRQEDRLRMGEYYREAPVYILKNGSLSEVPYEGLEHTKIDEFMNAYFNFLNNLDYSSSITDEYIKSQILHFYFVYIHPYFDVNGRTSRTLAMWYLLNKKAYPFIIFNRGITFKGSEYDKAIADVRKYRDISFFIDYMLKTVQMELEKEYIMQNIASNTNATFSASDWQTLLYLLSMNGLISACTFIETYNRYHEKKKPKFIYETMLDPLIQKGVLEVERTTKHNMFDNYANEVYRINPERMDYDKEKIRRLIKYK